MLYEAFSRDSAFCILIFLSGCIILLANILEGAVTLSVTPMRPLCPPDLLTPSPALSPNLPEELAVHGLVCGHGGQVSSRADVTLWERSLMSRRMSWGGGRETAKSLN